MSRSIFVNGKSDSNTIADLETLKLLAHLPGILSSEKKRVMVVGLGTGVTAGELTLYPEIEQIDVAEISPSVVEALPYFAAHNHDVHENPKVHIHVADAFRFLGRNTTRYDIVTSEPSNPWVTGVDQLFTEEFYTLVKNHLTPEGLFLQWVHLYASDLNMVGMVFNTVRSNFKSCHVFIGCMGDMLILASQSDIDAARLEMAQAYFDGSAQVRSSLAEIGVRSFDALLVREVIENAHMADKYSGFGYQTMDNPRLHYIAGQSFYKGSSMVHDIIFDSSVANYSANYLFAKHNGSLENRRLSSEKQTQLIHALDSITPPGYGRLPAAESLELKRRYHDKTANGDIGSREQKALDLLAIATSYPRFDDWRHIKLKSGTYKEKIQLLQKFVTKTRHWIFPYRLDGLKELTREGMRDGQNAQERNWCALQLILILLDDTGRQTEATDMLAGLLKNEENRPILDAHGQALLKVVKKRLALKDA